MILKKYIALLASLLGVIALLPAQAVLSLEEAIQIALENNHEIRIQQYDVEIQQLQNNPALVGRKPTVNLAASYELGWSDARIETLPLGPSPDGENSVLELDGFSNDFIVGPELNLLLLDGKASKYRLAQLGTLSELSQMQLQQVIEQTVVEVISAYLQMAQQQSLMDITRQSIELTQDRLARAIQDASYGTSSSLEELQIEVDLKTDSAALRNLVLGYDNARRTLNQLMGKSPDENYTINTQMEVNTALELSTLEQGLKANNTFLQLSDKNIQLADLDIQINKAAFKPTLQGYANLNFVYLQDDANFLQETRTIGPNIGLRFQYPLFDAGARKIRTQSAEITAQKRQLERLSTEEQLVIELHNAYATYRNTLEQLRIEESNLIAFETNLTNIQNRYKLGQATNTDVRTAQLNLNAAQNRINNYQYTIKQAEVTLYLLSGQLVN